MEMLWFWLVSVMVAIYAVMDGFDFGAGIHHLTAAKTNEERRTILAAIGPLLVGLIRSWTGSFSATALLFVALGLGAAINGWGAGRLAHVNVRSVPTEK